MLYLGASMLRTLVRSLSLVAILAGTAAAAGDPLPPESTGKVETQAPPESTGKVETQKPAKKKALRKAKKKAARKAHKKAKKSAKAAKAKAAAERRSTP